MCERSGCFVIAGKDGPTHVIRHSLYGISLPPAEPLAVLLQLFQCQFVQVTGSALLLLTVQARLYHGDETVAED